MKKSFTLLGLMLLSTLGFTQNNPPVAVNDYATTVNGGVLVNVLNNDFDSDGNYIKIILFSKQPKHGLAKKTSDSTISYQALPDFPGGMDTICYVIRDNGTSPAVDTGMLILDVDQVRMYGTISANNIKTGINHDGRLFSGISQYYDGEVKNYIQLFEVPKGKEKNTMFTGSLWIGGYDNLDSLHMAAVRYGSEGIDYFAGPVSSVYDSAYDSQFKRVWKITKADVDYHVANCWNPGYTPAPQIADWPGNGNPSLGQSPVLAPFYDYDNDQIYNPLAGDYPLIKGDEAVFFIFNDDRDTHGESGGAKLGIEVKGMLYSFNCPGDSALWNTVFVSYEIENRSSNTYHDVNIGSFVDLDLGNVWDDYVGCDVQRSSFYCYNGKNTDGTGVDGTYGAFPPAQSVTFLGGPFMDADGIDNPAGLCDNGVNGTNFGNGIVDDERYGMTHFISTNNTGSAISMIDPETAREYYNLTNGKWIDGTQMTYWGMGLPALGGTGPACSFLYPGSSDNCNWGTNGVNPGGTDPWTEIQAGNTPYDRRGLGTCGPIVFAPGDIQKLDLAFVFARNFSDTNATAAIPVMQQRIDSIRSYYKHDMTPCGESFSGIKPKENKDENLRIYPNPAHNFVTIEYANGQNAKYEVFSITGNLLKSGSMDKSGIQQLDLSGLQNGLYLIRVCNGSSCSHARFILQ